jgi:hypothetical protein
MRLKTFLIILALVQLSVSIHGQFISYDKPTKGKIIKYSFSDSGGGKLWILNSSNEIMYSVIIKPGKKGSEFPDFKVKYEEPLPPKPDKDKKDKDKDEDKDDKSLNAMVVNANRFIPFENRERFRDFDIYNDELYLIKEDFTIWKYASDKIMYQLPKGGIKIAVDPKTGTPWILGKDNKVYSFDGAKWVDYHKDKGGIEIVVYSGTPYVIGKDSIIYQGINNDFKEMPGGGKGKKIAIDKSTGNIWVIGTNSASSVGLIYKHNGTQWPLVDKSGQGKELCIVNDRPFVIGKDNHIHFLK